MSSISLAKLTEKLKDAPDSIIEKIGKYADALMNEKQNFVLSEDQKKHLLRQNDVSLDECKDADEVYEQLKKKYEL